MTGTPEQVDRIDALTAELAAVKADNARLRRLLSDEGMPDSLRHAFRDTVAMLHTLMRRTADRAEDVDSYAAHLGGRLDAIARARFLTDAFGEAELRMLIEDTLNVYLVRVGEQATLDGPDVRLRPKAAEVIALAMHELATNAVEHGMLGMREGAVAVSWRMDDGLMLTLRWQETGWTEPAVPHGPGFGTAVLLEMLPYELGGQATLSCEPDGLRCSITFPLTARSGRLISSEDEDDEEPDA